MKPELKQMWYVFLSRSPEYLEDQEKYKIFKIKRPKNLNIPVSFTIFLKKLENIPEPKESKYFCCPVCKNILTDSYANRNPKYEVCNNCRLTNRR